MEHDQHNQRHTAAKEFLKSLEQLEDILHQDEVEEEQPLEEESDTVSDEQVTDDELEIDLTNDELGVDLAAFEDAVADIEQYMEQKTKKK